MRRSVALALVSAVVLATAGLAACSDSSSAPQQEARGLVAACDPNYAGACVPIARDVDCAGGSGDGPAYVQGPVRVIGRDIYRLDRDGDGVACEPWR